jgi:hypothetical protein
MTRLLTRLAAPTALIALVLAWTMTGVALAGQESVTSGNVTATLDYGSDALNTFGATLTIARAGVTGFAAPIPKVACDGCVLVGQGADDVKVYDLDGDHEPEVMVVASTGGAECCLELGVWDWTGTNYRETDVDLGTVGFTLDDLDHDGIPEFNSFNSAFNALFTNTAEEFPPPDIEHYLHQDGVPVFVPVTTKFPAVIRKNAAEASKRVSKITRRDHDAANAAGLLTTYTADQLLLGKGTRPGLKLFDAQARRGVLGSAAAAKKARGRMLAFLSRHHYR